MHHIVNLEAGALVASLRRPAFEHSWAEHEATSQAQVAERMGISQGAVARIESGERDPHLSTLRRYAHAVRVRVIHMTAPADEARGVSRLLPGTWLGVEEWNRLPQTVGSR